MKAIIFYFGLLAMVIWGIMEVEKSIPIIRMEYGIVENRALEIQKALNIH